MTKVGEVLDTAGVSIKHWCSMLDGEPVYVPAPYGGLLESLMSSFKTFVPKEGDVWICGYPKSGNNWIHENVSLLLNGKPEPYDRLMIHCFVDFLPNLDHLMSRQSPRVFHTHFSYNRLPPAVRKTSKIITIMRNPKSTTVSHYHHMKNSEHTQYKGKFQDFWPVYIDGMTKGYLYDDWFTYNQTYWEATKLNDNIMIVFYEDLVQDQPRELGKISDFLGLSRTKAFYQRVTQLTTKDSLLNNWSQKHPDDLKFVQKMKPSLIYRKGIVDDWKNHFTVEENERFNQIYWDKMAGVPELAARIKFE